MITKSPLFIVIFMCSLFSISAQELPYLSDIAVPDSIAVKSYLVLRTEFFALFNECKTSVDSLALELKGKELVRRATLSRNKSDVAKFYLTLENLRDGDYDILEYILEYTRTNELDDSYEGGLLQKAIALYYDQRIKEALAVAEEAYRFSEKTQNISNKWVLKSLIGNLQVDYGNVSSGLQHLKEVESIYITGEVQTIHPYNTDSYNKDVLASIRYSIAKTYFEIDSLDEADDYIEKVRIYAESVGNKDHLDYYLGLKAGILIKQKRYLEGLDVTNQYISNDLKKSDQELSHSYAMQGIAYEGLNLDEKAITSFLTADSLFVSAGSDYYFDELKHTFKYLLNHYKKEGNTNKQIEYLNKMISYEESVGSIKESISNGVSTMYTIPELTAEKELLISKLEKEKLTSNAGVILFLILSCIAVIVAIFQHRKRLTYKKRFDNLKVTLEKRIKSEVSSPIKTTSTNKTTINNSTLQLKSTQTDKIKAGLKTFEDTLMFTEENITLKSLALQVGTNSSYLSKYINDKKSENFSVYINDLRINHVLKLLYSSEKIRTYTVSALAREVGFSNSKSFSNHFKRITGLSVTYFIKNLEDIKAAPAKEKGDNVIDFLERINKTG
ncbi:AraC family transcriptional regulator [Dokdonia sp. Dokd-P16]|uniref:helix-turn-helix domain-containing protein n=1 Tax=Dokdonia sp. Dokd-P16 TaxID=2173169 RepID=UPI000D54AA86|nr:AraC family transcriptional regulator [Dokdonia sp. Dokd-P16]AWH75350.1 AraC family transcriptional regulator [Dokdonia sp. Dokd-P16]